MQRARMRFVALAALVLAWWGTSGAFNVVTKRFLENSYSYEACIVVTEIQLLIAGILGLVFIVGKQTLNCTGDGQGATETIAKMWKADKNFWLGIGLLQLGGNLCTNLSLWSTFVSTAQGVKCTEPLFVLLFWWLWSRDKCRETISWLRVASMFQVVLGATMAVWKGHPSMEGVFFALVSCVLFGARSVLLKEKLGQGHGVENVFMMTVAVGFCEGLVLVVGSFVGDLEWLFFVDIHNMIMSSFNYFAYNFLSFILLAMISPTKHALLKVGKRISVFLAAAVFLAEILTVRQWSGVFLACVGLLLYDSSANKARGVLSLNAREVFVIGTAVCGIVILVIGTSVIQPETLQFRFYESSGKRNTLIVLGTPPDIYLAANDTVKTVFVSVWAYPYGPSEISLYTNEELLCGYQECVESSQGVGRRFSFRNLTSGTIFEDFARYHMFYKLVHMQNFPDHVQSVSILSLMLKQCPTFCHEPNDCRLCVRTANEANFQCSDDRNWKEFAGKYDALYNGGDALFPASQRPALREDFATLSYDSRIGAAGVANSGDEVQGFAGLQFVPYLTNFVDRDKGFPSGRGFLIANAWYGASTAWPPGPYMDPILTSIHISSEMYTVVKGRKAWFPRFTSAKGPIGSRDFGTLRFLKSMGIRTYFSACATLTINVLDPEIEKKFVVVVDAERNAIPSDIREDPFTIFLDANIPDDVKLSRRARFEYAFRLLKLYGSKARLVVTSRIHAALPSFAQGVPVVFVATKDLPGGGGGRIEGLIELFHVLNPNDENFEFDWKNPPPNPGNHAADRYRASFWSLFKSRTDLYEQSARLFGVIPLRRLGKGISATDYDIHGLFHQIVTTPPESVTWRMLRTVESIFYHHPNAKVIIHSPSLSNKENPYNKLVEAGYDLEIRDADLEKLLNHVKIDGTLMQKFLKTLNRNRKGIYWYSHFSDLLRFLVMYLYGGVYLDTDFIVIRPFEKDRLRNHFGFEDWENIKSNCAALIFEKRNAFMYAAIEEFVKSYKPSCWECNGPELLRRLSSRQNLQGTFEIANFKAFYPYAWYEAENCFRNPIGSIDLSSTFAVHLNTRITRNVNQLTAGTVCEQLYNQYCIFCEDDHISASVWRNI